MQKPQKPQRRFTKAVVGRNCVAAWAAIFMSIAADALHGTVAVTATVVPAALGLIWALVHSYVRGGLDDLRIIAGRPQDSVDGGAA